MSRRSCRLQSRSQEPQRSASQPRSPNRSSLSALLGQASDSGQIPSTQDGNRDIGSRITLMRFLENDEDPAVPSMPARRQRTSPPQSPLIVDGSIRRRDVGRNSGTNHTNHTNSGNRTNRTNRTTHSARSNSLDIRLRPSLSPPIDIRSRQSLSLSPPRDSRSHPSHDPSPPRVNGHGGDHTTDIIAFDHDTRSDHEIHMDRDDPNLYRSYNRELIARNELINPSRADSPPEESVLDSEEHLEQATSQYIYTRPSFTEVGVDLSIEVAAVEHRLAEVPNDPTEHLRVFLEFFARDGVRGATTIRGPRHQEFPHQTRLHFMFDELRQRFASAGNDLLDVTNDFASIEELDGLRYFIELEMHALGAALDYYRTGSTDRSSPDYMTESTMAVGRLETEYTRSSIELGRIRTLYFDRVRVEVSREIHLPGPFGTLLDSPIWHDFDLGIGTHIRR